MRRFGFDRDLVKVLMRADDGLDAELGLESFRLALIPDESGDVKTLPVGMV